MAPTTFLGAYLNNVVQSVSMQDGIYLAEHLSFDVSPQSRQAMLDDIARLPGRGDSDDNLVSYLNGALAGQGLGEYVNLIRCYANYLKADENSAHAFFTAVLNEFATNVFNYFWQIPVLKSLCFGLELLAAIADDGQHNVAKRHDKSVVTLDTFSRVAAIITRERKESRYGYLAVANAVFRISFRISEMNRCSKVIEQAENLLATGLTWNDFPPSHVVAYRYNDGVVKMSFHEFDKADEALTYAYRRLPRNHHNRRIILQYLTVCRLVRCAPIPTHKHLADYGLDGIFWPLIAALMCGNYRSYQHEVELRREWFKRRRLYTIMKHRVKLTLFRNLCRIVHANEGERGVAFGELSRAARLVNGAIQHNRKAV
ncbi:PCI domain-containing protein 2 [Irineochytrium annulatum]|nr:PCI domain-containing protein 2 [Irineochytrium annulatum]